jgi:hypothetical protein
MGVIYEMQRFEELGAYSARTVLAVMVSGLEEELDLRLKGKIGMASNEGPSVDSDSFFEEWQLEDVNVDRSS